ncbi:MAG: hypothetical protein JNK58_09205 [Phycisphaerae bacterium]|nr:hypothetical protein [Phycisphaerae bacterium]
MFLMTLVGRAARIASFAVSLTWSALPAFATLPTSYTYQLQVRSNFAQNPGGAFNIPGSWFFNSNDAPGLNDQDQVSTRITVTSGDFHALWFGGGGTGAVVHQGPLGSFFSATSLNNSGEVVFEQSLSAANGVYRYRSATGITSLFTNRPLGASGWGTPQINNLSQTGFRASFSGSGTAFVSSTGEAFPPIHVAEVGVDSLSPYSFLFTPSFNNNRQIASSARLGGPGQTGSSQPDEVRIFNADGSSVLIAQDRNANPASNYRSFDNSVDLNDLGWVAFTATLEVPSGARGVFISNGTQTITIARTDGGIVSNIEFFAPAINNSNLVAFRAFDAGGLRAVWVGDGTGLVRVATEHDILPTDQGPGRIDQNDASPVFGGGPSINSAGNVAFNAALTPPGNNQVEWGTGLFVATAVFPPPPHCVGDADSDGDREFADITAVLANFNNMTIPFGLGDADGSGVVDFADITSVLALFGQPCPTSR